MVFHKSLSNSKSPQISRTLLRILVILNNVPNFFFNSLARSRTYYSFHILPVLFCGQLGQQSRPFCKSFFFLLIIIRSGRLAEIRWSVCMSKSHMSLCVSFSRTGAGFCIYHLFVWSNLNFLHNSQWIILPTQSCLVLHSFCANFLHSFIMWLMVILLPESFFFTSA